MKTVFTVPTHFQCTQQQFDNKQTKDTIPIKCVVCCNSFLRLKKNILKNYVRSGSSNEYCSDACKGIERTAESYFSVNCLSCNISFFKV